MKSIFHAASIAVALLFPAATQAQNRYVERPPVLVSPDLSAPWVLQLGHVPSRVQAVRQPVQRERAAAVRRQAPAAVPQTRQPALAAAAAPRSVPPPEPALDPKFLPQEVAYDGPQKPGTIVIDTKARFLYLVQEGGKARRYGVGVGKEGFSWTGTERITMKREWPEWRPPAEMIAREKKKGRILPARVSGGLHNPLGARALYLGDTLYRIHGTNAPWTIGHAVSSGCIRMRNEDVIDLYERVSVGTKVVVI